MTLAEHLHKWLSLEGQEAKLAYLMQHADPLMGDEAEAELKRRLDAATPGTEQNALQEHLQMREALKALGGLFEQIRQQVEDDPMGALMQVFEQAQDVAAVAAFVARTPDALLDQLEERLEAALAAQTGDARAVPEARLKGLRAVREAEQAFNHAKDLSRSPVEQAVLQFLRAETEADARAYALANKDLLLTAQGQAEIDTYRENDRVNERKALLRQMRLELAQPARPPVPLPGEMALETDRAQPSASDGETLHARQPLSYRQCQFGDNNLMINNVERVPLQWVRPQETGKEFWEGAVGRKVELATLRQKLHDEQQCSILSVHGLPAIGKSTLAALYAHTYSDDYPGGVIWLQYRPDVTTAEQAKVPLRVAARFAYAANPEASEILDNRYAVEPDVVQALLSGHGRLLIIVDDVWTEAVALTVRQALPADAHVLLTTRDSDVAGAFVSHRARALYELDVLTEADARLLLREIAPELPEDVAEALVKGLDGHAQALTIAGYTLQRSAYRGAAGIRADCDEILRRVREGVGFGNLSEVKDDLRKRIRKFETVLSYSYDRLAEAFREAGKNYQPYFRALGTLADGADFSAEAFAAICGVADGGRLLNELRQFGLVKELPGSDGAPSRWSQHQILRAYALSLQTPEERLDLPERHADYYAKMLHNAENAHVLHKTYGELPNLRMAFYWSVEQNFALADYLLQDMSDVFSGFNLGQEHYEWAQRLLEKSIEYGSGRQSLIALMRRAHAYVNLSRVEATLEGRRKRLLDALADYNEALPLREGVPSEKASTLNNRAVVQSDLAPLEATLEGRRKRLLDALADYNEALPLREGVPSEKASTLNNRAVVQSDLAPLEATLEGRRKRLLDALADYNEALPLREGVPSEKASTLNNRANVQSDLAPLEATLEGRRKRLLDALADYNEALPLREGVPSEKASTLNNRANVQRDLAPLEATLEGRRKRLLDALADYNEALPLMEGVPSEKASTLNNRANVQRDLAPLEATLEGRRKRLLDALADYNEALPLMEGVPSEKARTLNNRANVQRDLAPLEATLEGRRKRLLDALADYNEALPLMEGVPSEKARTLNNRANVQRDLAPLEATLEGRRKRLLDALADYNEALPLMEGVPSEKARTLNNRANVQRDLAPLEATLEGRRKRLLDALADYNEALPLREGVPSEKARTLNNRANVQSDLAPLEATLEGRRKRLLDALADYNEALPLREGVPSEKASTLNNRAVVQSDLAPLEATLEGRRKRLLDALADYNEALPLMEGVPSEKARTLNNRANVQSDLAPLEATLEGRRKRLLDALADYNEALPLMEGVPSEKASTLNNRANVQRDLAPLEATLEGRRKRLLDALADYNEALPLMEGVPSEKASTLNNRANVQRDLAPLEATLEGRRKRLLDALKDVWEALQTFTALGIHQYIEITRNVLLRTAIMCGFALFSELWQEITGEESLPEFEGQAVFSAFAQLEGIESDEQFGQRLQEDADFKERFEDVMKLAGNQTDIAPENAEQLQALANLLIEWVQTPDWGASEQYLVAHQAQLLTAEAVLALQLLIQSNNGHQTLVQHLEMLRRAIADGIEAAYAPLKQSLPEQLQQAGQLLRQAEKPEEQKAIIAMWLMLGLRFVQQETIGQDELRQFTADLETVVLPKAEASGEAQLIDACKHLLGWAYHQGTAKPDDEN